MRRRPARGRITSRRSWTWTPGGCCSRPRARDSATVAAFADDLTGHGGDPQRVSDTSSDMSRAFIAGIGEHLPNAKLTYDRYHVIAKLNEAVDQVRRAEQKDNPALKKTRYV